MMDKLMHSHVLFLSANGMPMNFCVRSCKEKGKLIALIEHGNGIIQQTPGPNVIRVVEVGCKVLNPCEEETVAYVQYIFDCVEQNKLLDITDYSIKLESDVVSDISSHDDDDCSLYPLRKANFQNVEDKILIKYYLKNLKRFRNMSKEKILSEVLRKKILRCPLKSLRKRTDHILSHIKNYNLNSDEQKNIKKIFPGGNLYTEQEDMKMIEYIIKRGLHMRIREKVIYHDMANDKILDRTPRSMFKHFTRIVLQNLDKYNIPEHYVALLNSSSGFSKKDSGDDSDDDRESHLSLSDFRTNIHRTKENTKRSIAEICQEANNVLDENHTPYTAEISYCMPSRFLEPRACKNVAKKRKYYEQNCNENLNIDDFLSDEDISNNFKAKSSTRQTQQLALHHLNDFKSPSRKITEHQENRVSVTQHSRSVRRNCKTSSRNAQSISTKTSDALKSIVSSFEDVSKAGSENANTSSNSSIKKVPFKTLKTRKRELQLCSEKQGNSKIATKETCAVPSQTRDKNQTIFKFFNVEKCSLTLSDTLDNLISERDQLFIHEPNIEITTLDESVTGTFCVENFTEPSRLEIEESFHSIVNDQTEQLSMFSIDDNSSYSVVKDNNNSPLNRSKHKSNLYNLKDSSAQLPNIDSNEMQTKMNGEESKQVENENIDMECALDVQAEETLDEMISPTAESIPETCLEECGQTQDDSSETLDGSPSASSNEKFFIEAISILKKMEHIIANMDASPEKNDLENNINELYFSLYRQRFKTNIRNIMKKDKLSITDKALLLKYIAYTKSAEPQDIVHKLKS